MAKPQNNLFKRLTQFMINVLQGVLFRIHPAFIFIALFIITVFWASFLPSLKFNYDIESFFSSDDPEVDFYYHHQTTFENENDFLLVGIKNAEGIFQYDFLEKIDALSDGLKKIPGIEKVTSPTRLYETILGPLGSLRIPVVHVNKPEKYSSDKKRIYKSGQYVNSIFSQDLTSVSLLIKKKGKLSRQANDSLLYAVKTMTGDYQFDAFHLAGRIQTQQYYVTRMKEQMALFGFLALVLFLGSLFIIFKCIRYVSLSFGAVVLSQIWIFGIIGWLGIPLDLMLTLLPTLIFVISTSGSIHLISRFRKEYKIGVPKQTAIRTSIIETGMPNFLNAFTTSLGFASLVMIPVAPIQLFGILTAVGILISFFIGLLFIPTALKVLQINPSKITLPVEPEPKSRLIEKFVFSKPKVISGIFAIIMLFGIYFSFQIKVNNHFLDDLSSSSSLKKDLDFFEQNFSGIRPFEINIQAESNLNVLEFYALQEMDIVEKYLQKEYNVGFLLSPLSLIKQINKAAHGGNQDYYCLPDSPAKLDEILKLADKQRLWRRFIGDFKRQIHWTYHRKNIR